MMKTKNILIFSLLLLFATGPLAAQKIYKLNPAKMQFARAELKAPAASEAILPAGKWYKTFDKEYADYRVYKPAQVGRMQWGDYLDFAAASGFAKGYNAPCGNDTNIHRHEGKASIAGEVLTLDLGPEGIQKFKIVVMNAEMLALAEIK